MSSIDAIERKLALSRIELTPLGKDVYRGLLMEIDAYRFCWPRSSFKAKREMILVKDARATLHRINDSREIAKRYSMRSSALNLKSKDHLATDLLSGKDGTSSATGYFVDELKSMLKRSKHELPNDFGVHVSLYLSLSIVVADTCRLSPDAPLRLFADAFRSGFMPIRIVGSPPRQCLEVYCPHDRPHAHGQSNGLSTDAPARSKAAYAEIAQRADEVIKRHRAHPGFASAPAVRLQWRSQWEAMARAEDPIPLLRSHFSPLVQVPSDRRYLDHVLSRVRRVTINKGDLVITIQEGEEDNETPLRCRPPYMGAIDHMPQEMIPVLRLHNGLRYNTTAWSVILFPYRNGRFQARPKPWLTPAPKPTDDPYSLIPLQAPLKYESDYYLYHPSDRRAGKHAVLQTLDHEVGLPNKTHPTGAGGLFLRLISACLAEGGLK